MDLETLPGGHIVAQGLADLEAGRRTEASLLVQIGSPKLKALGFEIKAPAPPLVEHQLYELLAETDSDSAHSRYNALIRLLVSFERAAACVS